MAVTMSKPPKKTTITRSKDAVRGVRWRSAEERAESKRKIEAIRRAAELERMKFNEGGFRINAKTLRSPKVLGGFLFVFLLLGLLLSSATSQPRKALVETEPLIHRRVKKSLNNLALATTRFRLDTGDWPSQSYGLFELCHNYGHRGYKGPYIDWAYKDPWNTPFVYIRPKSKHEAPIIFSCGPDKKPDTADDFRLTPEDFAQEFSTWQTPQPETPDAIPILDQGSTPVTQGD